MTSVGVTMALSGMSCSVIGISSSTICNGWTEVTIGVLAADLLFLGQEGEFQIGVAAAFADARAVAIDGHGAANDEIDSSDFIERHRAGRIVTRP